MYQIIYCETTGHVKKTFFPPKPFLLGLFVHFWHIATYLPGVWISDERTMELDVSSLWVSLFVSCLLKCSWFTMLWLFQVYRKVIHTHSHSHTHTHTHTHTRASLIAQRVKNLPAKQTQVQPLAWEDPLEEENGNPLQYSYLKNPTYRGASWAAVHRVAKNWTWLSD